MYEQFAYSYGSYIRKYPMYITLDGIDGSGKSTIIDTWASYLREQGKRIFSLPDYWQAHHIHPTIEELSDADVIVTAEPTRVWVGAAIRNELIRPEAGYTAHTISAAYALDRLIHLKRIIIPSLTQGKIVIQDRGVSTSLCYNPLQEQGPSIDDVAQMEGNQLALAHAPNHLVIADISPERALERLSGREKKDHALYEQLAFLTTARQRYFDSQFQSFFITRHTAIHILNTDTPLDIMKKEAIHLLQNILEKNTY